MKIDLIPSPSLTPLALIFTFSLAPATLFFFSFSLALATPLFFSFFLPALHVSVALARGAGARFFSQSSQVSGLALVNGVPSKDNEDSRTPAALPPLSARGLACEEAA